MRYKKIVSLLLSAVLLLCGCGGGAQEESHVSTMDKEAVFREEPEFLETVPENMSGIQLIGETIYIDEMTYHWQEIDHEEEVILPEPREEVVVVQEEDTSAVETGEETEEETQDTAEEMEEQEEGLPGATRTVTGYDLSGKQVSKVDIAMTGNESGGSITVDSQGNIYGIVTQFATYEEGDTTDKVHLKAYDKGGKELWSIHLNENLSEEVYYHVSQLYLDEKQQLLVDSARGVEIYDLQGKPVRMIEKPESMDCSLRRIRDNKFVFVFSDGEKAYIQPVNIENGQTQDQIEIPFNYYRYTVQNGRFYDLYLSDEYGVYGYNVGDQEPLKLMDFISSDFGGTSIYHMLFLDETTFVGVYFGETGNAISKFIKVPSSEIQQKTELTLGCYYLEPKIKQQLVDFNKKSTEYKITIVDYATYDSMNDYTQGLTKLNTDIISGKVPDILLLNDKMPVSSYISKGLFCDYNELIEKDPEFIKEDYMPNIFEALSYEDGLYQLAPSFSVTTFAAKTKVVGEEPGWTMGEAMELMKAQPEGTQLLSEMTRSNLLYYTTWIGIDDYVNWETGECSFDSPGFQAILEYAKTLPREIDYTAVMDDESYWNEMEAQYRNGKTIMSMFYIGGFSDYQTMKQGTFGEEITLIGFPTEQGIGAGLNFNTRFAISSQGKNQQAAWEFVKGFFTKEYQDSLEYEFPVRISSLEKLEEKSWSKPYYEDEQGNKIEYDNTFYLNGVEVVMEPLTKEETGFVKDYLGTVTNVASPNEDIYNIILEETESYFNGQKTTKDVADIIQSRVKIYVNENR